MSGLRLADGLGERLAENAGRSLTAVLVVLACVVVVGVGTAGALCKLALDCGLGGNAQLSDATLLRRLQAQNAGAPHGVFSQGLHEQIVASGFSYPTDFAFLPSGEVLVSEKDGLVVEATPGRLGSRVVLDLRDRVDTSDYRGVISVAVSPTFAADRRIYVLYVLKPTSPAPRATTVARFSSFVLPAGGGRARSERVLVGSVRTQSCSGVPARLDCLPSDLDHDGGEAAFARDGSIFLATGDGGGYDTRVEPTALAAQDVDSLAGKILHVTSTGLGLPSNPFWNGDPRANRSKVWATGLRNPFRLTLDSATGTPIVGDVGAHAYEEIDAAPRGADLGWPCWEAAARVRVYAGTRLCKALYRTPPPALERPLLALPHPLSNSIVGGTFAPASFPAASRGSYLFGDWVRGWIRSVRLDRADSALVGQPEVLATRLPGPVALHLGPDGDLYYLALDSGDLRRVSRG